MDDATEDADTLEAIQVQNYTFAVINFTEYQL